jgi:ABC-type phosphate transport system substrate-binding protein
MSRTTSTLVRTAVLITVLHVAAQAQCTAGELAVVVNKINPTESLSMAQLRKLILGDVRTWPDRKPVLLVSREFSSDVFRCVLSSIVRMNDGEYHRYILSTEFRGGDPLAVKTVPSDAMAAKYIAAMAGSIAIVQSSDLPAIASTVRVVRINGREPGESGYPLQESAK